MWIFSLLVPAMAFGPLDFVASINQYFVLIIIVVALTIMWKYKNRIIFLITGDDRLHGNGLDLLWFGCRKCFGMFPNDCYCFGLNLKKKCGRALGLVSTPLRISNIRAGDLPFHGSGDFYLTIECGDHPPITTSVVEDADPKVVHFLEPINIRLRDNMFENALKFIIKEEDVFGSKCLCEFVIEAKTVFDQLDATQKDLGDNFVMKRYKMDVVIPDWIPETPPWIIMEMTTQMDNSLEEVHEHPHNRTTALMTRRPLLTSGLTSSAAVYEKFSPEDLKRNFELVDGQGRVAMEPDEKDLETLRSFKKRKLYENYLFFLVIFLVIVGYGLFRFYTWSCFSQFRRLTIGNNFNMTLPISQQEQDDVTQQCVGEVLKSKPACFPSHQSVEEKCKSIPHAYQPKAFAHLWYTYTGWKNSWLTVRCSSWICPVHAELAANDLKICLLIILLAGSYALHYYHVRSQIKEMNRHVAEKMASNLRGTSPTTASGRRANGSSMGLTRSSGSQLQRQSGRDTAQYDAQGYSHGYTPVQQRIS